MSSIQERILLTMSEKRIFYVPQVEPEMELPEDEAGHCIRVLRLREGDELLLSDGGGKFYDAVISSISGKHCYISVNPGVAQPQLWKGRLSIGIAPTKLMERNEWFVEKAVELGINEIAFLKTDHSERDVVKIERVEKIAVAAMKQSQKALLPDIVPVTPFREFVRAGFDGDCYIAHCEPGEKRHLMDLLVPGRNARVLIGPEGDFSPAEIKLALECGYKPVSLGESRLRTETAALAAVHMMGLANRI